MEHFTIEQRLENWVMDKCRDWEDHFNSNYRQKFDEYDRIWRGIWSPEDRTKDSERSKIISPATQQAVESSVAEIEEATFGRGRFFDMSDDDDQPQDIAQLRELLYTEFEKNKVRKAIAESLVIAAVYGTGIADIDIDEIEEAVPATQPILDGELNAVGIQIRPKVVVKPIPVLPHNFRIEPGACTIEESLGVAIDRYVPLHTIELRQEKGIYRNVDVKQAIADFNIQANKNVTIDTDNLVRLTKYYGLVPRHLLEAAMNTDENGEQMEVAEITDSPKEKSQYVEAIVIIANESVLLKATENPYMMNDRPVVAFPWDVVPGSFWGRGVVEKAYNSQKALDAELRARIDALALTVHPMMAIDATRLPRGFSPEIKAGKMFLTQGNPAEVLQPFNFGQVSQITFAQAAELQKMVQTATGAVDSAGIPGSINGEATAAGISMSLGAIIKRHKRTLINFQESFLIPFVEKAAYRYMQYAPERFPAKDFSFYACSTLGIIAREYEVTQLVQLLQTMKPDSPVYTTLIKSIIDNMNLSNREELIAQIDQASQPDPEQQKMAMAAQQAQLEFQQSQTNALVATAEESRARAAKYIEETKTLPIEMQLKLIETVLSEGNETDKEFKRRLELAKVMLEERKVAAQENKQQRQNSQKVLDISSQM